MRHLLGVMERRVIQVSTVDKDRLPHDRIRRSVIVTLARNEYQLPFLARESKFQKPISRSGRSRDQSTRSSVPEYLEWRIQIVALAELDKMVRVAQSGFLE